MLLSVAAVATAWSSYQAARWNGEQAKTASRANARPRRGGARAGPGRGADRGRRGDVHPVGGRQRARRRGAARTSTRSGSATSSSRRSRRGWPPIRSSPPDAPPTPFAMDEYKLEAADEAEELDARGGGARRPGAPQHPAVDELHARRGAVRGVAVLRRHQHEARGARLADRAARDGHAGVPGDGGVDRDVPRSASRSTARREPTSARSAGRRRGGCRSR